MQVSVYNQNGESVGTMDLPDALFDVPMQHDMVHQAIVAQDANSRHAIAHTKGRGEVRGGGKKPWRQKGTGRARHASIRSPIWKSGGVAFGPTKERNFTKKINKKFARKALAMALSSKVRDEELMVLDNMNFDKPKTKLAAAVLKKLIPKSNSILVITPLKDRALDMAMRNLPNTGIIAADSINVRDILAKKHVLMLRDAVSILSKTFIK